MKGTIWTVAVVALALALALGGANVAFADAAETETATRTLTIDKGTTDQLQIDAYETTDTITVTNESGHNLTRGEDYAYNASSTSIEWLLSSDQADGENVTAEIDVLRHERAEKTPGNILSTVAGSTGHLLLIVGLGALLFFVFGGGSDF